MTASRCPLHSLARRAMAVVESDARRAGVSAEPTRSRPCRWRRPGVAARRRERSGSPASRRGRSGGPAWPRGSDGGPEHRRGRSGGPAWLRGGSLPGGASAPPRPCIAPRGRLVSLAVLAAFLLGALWLASALHVSAAGEQLPAGERLHPAVGDFFSYFSEIEMGVDCIYTVIDSLNDKSIYGFCICRSNILWLILE